MKTQTAVLIQQVKAAVAVAKRDPNRAQRDAANVQLIGLYAELARRQKAGDVEASVKIDMGAL